MKNKSLYIIIEGQDRVGKDTQQELLIRTFQSRRFHKLHYSKLPVSKNKQESYSKGLYNDMFKMLNLLKNKAVNFILNRSHLGESVYANLYRGYSGDYVFNIEEKYADKLKDNLYLILLVNNDIGELKSRDDGESISLNTEDLLLESVLFEKAFQRSKIKNKLLINVNDLSIQDVHEKIIEFIETDKSLHFPHKQLNLFKDESN